VLYIVVQIGNRLIVEIVKKKISRSFFSRTISRLDANRDILQLFDFCENIEVLMTVD